MRFTFRLQAVSCLLLAGLGNAVPFTTTEDDLTPRAELSELTKRAPTCNTPSNRACWTNGFDINTDYEASFPATGVVRNVGPFFSLQLALCD